MRLVCFFALIATTAAGRELVAPGGVVSRGSAARGGMPGAGTLVEPPIGFWVAGSSVEGVDGVYGPRLEHAALPPMIAPFVTDPGLHGVWLHDTSGWVLVHAEVEQQDGEEPASEWVLVDPRGRERYVHAGGGFAPGSGAPGWSHLRNRAARWAAQEEEEEEEEEEGVRPAPADGESDANGGGGSAAANADGNATFECDGGTRLRAERVNDDSYDCGDGSDEPRTAACPSGGLTCANEGHAPTEVRASRVNDGVCDCCDGGDEWATPGLCENSSAAAAVAAAAACDDAHVKCEVWARRGECKRNRDYMEGSCRRACGLCGGGAAAAAGGAVTTAGDDESELPRQVMCAGALPKARGVPAHLPHMAGGAAARTGVF